MTDAFTEAVLPHALTHHPLVEKLGWVLLHFLWEGALVAGALALALTLLRRRPPSARYAAGLLALAAMAVLPVLTWQVLPPASPSAAAPAPPTTLGYAVSPRAAPLPPLPAAPSGEEGAAAATFVERVRRGAGQSAPLVALGWLLGVALLALRTAGGWGYVLRLRSGATPASKRWRRRFRALVGEMGLAQARRQPALLVSSRAEGPAAVGWLRPAVLVPTGFLTGLPPEQVEAILRHELAHIRRHDYLVSLAQAALETLLFYHPAVWWVSGRVRTLREHCCDDAAATAGESRLSYARALAALEGWRSATAFAPAATGGSLLARIRRVTGQRASAPRAFGWPAATALVALLVLGACAAGARVGDEETAPAAEEPVDEEVVQAGEAEAPAERPAPPAPAQRDTTPLRVRVLATERDTVPRVQIYTARGDTVIADTVHAGVELFHHGAVSWDSLGARRFERLKRLFDFDHERLDSLTTFTWRRADSTLLKADSVLSRFNVRFDDSLHFPSPKHFDNFRVRFPDPEAFDSLTASLRGHGAAGWTLVRPDTIFENRAARAERRALERAADRLDARAEELAEAGREDAARALREESQRLRQHRQRLEEHRQRLQEHGDRMEEHRQRLERHRRRMERHRERLEEQQHEVEERVREHREAARTAQRAARQEQREAAREARQAQREALREQAAELHTRADQQQEAAEALRRRAEALREEEAPEERIEALRQRADALAEQALTLRRQSRQLRRQAGRLERDTAAGGDQMQEIE